MNKYIGLILICLLMIPVPASAHSNVIDSKPAEGEEVSKSLNEIILTFNAGIKSVSTATIINEDSEEVAIENVEVETHLLKISLANPLIAGNYTVEWKALGEDTHATEGSFSFKVVATEEAIDEEHGVEEELMESDVEMEQPEQKEEIPLVEEGSSVEPSPSRLFLPILISGAGALAMILLMKFVLKRFR
jgi:copper resistance protein C